MPDITYALTLQISKGKLSSLIAPANVTASMNTVGIQSGTYALSGTPANISTATLSSGGLAVLQSLATHTASTCVVGVNNGGSFVPFQMLRAGEVSLIRINNGTLYQATGTSGDRLRVDITEG